MNIQGFARELRWMLGHCRESLRPVALLRQGRNRFRAWHRFWRRYHEYCRLLPQTERPSLEHLYPCLGDDAATTPIEPIYFYQDSWAFEHIVRHRPEWHIDVGSHHKFVALLSKVIPVTMVDIRPLSLAMDSLTFRYGNIMDMPFEDGVAPSVSSLCVVEHIGLGRYGDALDPRGTEKAIAELKRIVQPGGHLYLSIPVDRENCTYFDAHRAFAEPYLLNLFRPFEVAERRYIYGCDFGDNLQPRFGTGCYLLKRPS